MRDLAIVLQVLGEVDGGHTAGAELALDAVAVGESGGEARRLGPAPHRFCSPTSRASSARTRSTSGFMEGSGL